MTKTTLKVVIVLAALVAALPLAFVGFMTWAAFSALDANTRWATGAVGWWIGFAALVYFAFAKPSLRSWQSYVLIVPLLVGLAGVGWLEVLAWNDRKGVIPPGLFGTPYAAVLIVGLFRRKLSNGVTAGS